jgi:hypothetical protein
MHVLTDSEFHKDAEPILRQVFIHYEDDAIFKAFSSSITERRIIYPCCGGFDSAIPVEVLVSAASAIGDDSCYISNLWQYENEPNHCFVYLSEMLVGYSERTPCNDDQIIGHHLGMDVYPLESVIYSTRGSWGIRLSHEHYGLIGGSSDFMEIIEDNVPNLNTQVYAFFKKYDGWSNRQLKVDWIPPIIKHVYGEKKSKLMLERSGLGFTQQ